MSTQTASQAWLFHGLHPLAFNYWDAKFVDIEIIIRNIDINIWLQANILLIVNL